MNQGARRIIDTLAVLGAVIVIAEISFGAGLSTGPIAERPRAKRGTYTQKAGDTAFAATKRHGKVHRADEANFAELVLKSDVPVLVDFYADWCGPCRMVAPVLEELARETTDVRIVKVNVDHSPRLAARYGINSIPSLKVFEDGEVVDEHVGLARKSQLKKMLAKQQSGEAPVEGGARTWMRR